MTKSNVTLVYIICKNRTEAKSIAAVLLDKKLIACANMLPIESMYTWKGKIENIKEFVLIAKTKSQQYGTVQKLIKKMHSYKTPCILKIDAVANESYYKWLIGEMR